VAAVGRLWCAGPPGEPAGVHGYNAQDTSVDLTWWPSKDNGRPVLYYIVEIFNINENYWKRQSSASSLCYFDCLIYVTINVLLYCQLIIAFSASVPLDWH